LKPKEKFLAEVPVSSETVSAQKIPVNREKYRENASPFDPRGNANPPSIGGFYVFFSDGANLQTGKEQGNIREQNRD